MKAGEASRIKLLCIIIRLKPHEEQNRMCLQAETTEPLIYYVGDSYRGRSGLCTCSAELLHVD